MNEKLYKVYLVEGGYEFMTLEEKEAYEKKWGVIKPITNEELEQLRKLLKQYESRRQNEVENIKNKCKGIRF